MFKRCQVSFNGVKRVCKEVSRMFQEYFKKVSRVFEGRRKGVSREFSVSFKGIWISSQGIS